MCWVGVKIIALQNLVKGKMYEEKKDFWKNNYDAFKKSGIFQSICQHFHFISPITIEQEFFVKKTKNGLIN